MLCTFMSIVQGTLPKLGNVEIIVCIYMWLYIDFCFRYHSEKAISILNNLVPKYHLLLASAQRVKALILEEIALDIVHNQQETASSKSFLCK